MASRSAQRGKSGFGLPRSHYQDSSASASSLTKPPHHHPDIPAVKKQGAWEKCWKVCVAGVLVAN
ncbi:predicted protein [Histoplasma capsulatum H143]|uniref:Uncharacterized protein n=1 Tax=Ajellomyces capsulatus (strain H143) TaxID=544712 RepID=C6HLU9_AJECH|nr:predicted protein [Histoplasma capsulatum H143]